MKARPFLLVGLLEHTLEHLLDTVPKISTEEGVQQRIHTRVEVGHEEGERGQNSIKIRVSLVVLGPAQGRKRKRNINETM